mgnify:CR=1 FL=1
MLWVWEAIFKETYMKDNTMFLIRSILIIGVLLSLAGLAYGKTYPPAPQAGDYRANSGTPKVSSATGWQRHDGTNWVAATQSPLAYQQPFTSRIYMGAVNNMEVDSNFVMHGDFYSPLNEKKMVTVKAGKTFEFGANQNSIYRFCNITVEAGARLINNGTMRSVGKSSGITLKAGTTPDGGGTLENRWLIDSEGFLDKEAHSVLISGPNGVIKGIIIINVTDGAVFYIANPGGYSAAIQSTGNQNIKYARLIYNGAPNQSSGDIPAAVYMVTVANGTHLTLSEDVTLIDRHGTAGEPYPTFRVESGATLDTSTYKITSDKANNQSEAQFVLESGATIRTPNANGISSVKSGNKITSGAIQTNNATYSEGANYVYYGNEQDQFSGCFVTDPPTNLPADPVYRVHDLTVENPNGLRLCPNFQPLYYTGTLTGGNLIETGPTNTHGTIQHETLPVTLSYFNAFFNGFDSVILQWETQSETNNLGFYVLRSVEPDAALANVVSDLVPAANSSQGAIYYFEDADLYEDGVYYYWLQDVSFTGEIELHGPTMAQVTLQGGSNHVPDLPLKTGLIRNYPNPFNPSTQLEYYLENSSDVCFEVYNLRGQMVEQFTLRNQANGFHRYKWKPQLSSGTYLIKFTADGKSNIRKVLLAK